jgi:hypothetical protein
VRRTNAGNALKAVGRRLQAMVDVHGPHLPGHFVAQPAARRWNQRRRCRPPQAAAGVKGVQRLPVTEMGNRSAGTYLPSGLGIGEAAITLQPVITTVQQLFDLQVADLAEGIVRARLRKAAICLWSRCAPPTGSLTILSTRPSALSRCAVMPSASAASCAFRRFSREWRHNPRG